MMDGVMCHPGMSDSDTHTKLKFMKKYVGAAQSQLKLNMKNR